MLDFIMILYSLCSLSCLSSILFWPCCHVTICLRTFEVTSARSSICWSRSAEDSLLPLLETELWTSLGIECLLFNFAGFDILVNDLVCLQTSCTKFDNKILCPGGMSGAEPVQMLRENLQQKINRKIKLHRIYAYLASLGKFCFTYSIILSMSFGLPESSLTSISAMVSSLS